MCGLEILYCTSHGASEVKNVSGPVYKKHILVCNFQQIEMHVVAELQP